MSLRKKRKNKLLKRVQTKLKPCPFCGSNALEIHVEDINPFCRDAVTGWPTQEICITCKSCFISAVQILAVNQEVNPSQSQIRAYAYAKWNKRYNK